MVIFDNFGVLKSVLKLHMFDIFNCEESVRIRLICKGLIRFFAGTQLGGWGHNNPPWKSFSLFAHP